MSTTKMSTIKTWKTISRVKPRTKKKTSPRLVNGARRAGRALRGRRHGGREPRVPIGMVNRQRDRRAADVRRRPPSGLPYGEAGELKWQAINNSTSQSEARSAEFEWCKPAAGVPSAVGRLD